VPWGRVRHVAVLVSFATGLGCAVAVWGFWGPALTAFAITVPILSVAVLVGVRGLPGAVRVSLVGSLGTVACAGLVGAFGWSGVIVVVALAVTSPFLKTLLTIGRTSSRPGQPVPWNPAPVRETRPSEERNGSAPSAARTRLASLEELPDADAVGTLDDEALCRAWRRSYLRLDAGAVGRRLVVVRLRQLYLDELTRRHPAEVRQWFASGARAAGNPLPFLQRPSIGSNHDVVDVDWPDPESG